jgi:adenylate kinase
MIAVVFGIQGVGKSAVLGRLQEKTSVERIYWGGVTTELAIKEGLIKNVDEIRKLNVPTQKRLQVAAADIVLKQIDANKGKNIIVETHAALKTPQGFMPGFTQEILNKIKPDVFIVLEAHPENIYQRRVNDPTRVRDHDKSVVEIDVNLRATRWFASVYSVLSDGTLYILENKQDDLDFAVDKIIELLNLH